MKLLGIDYGSKRVGLAVSDDGGTMAFPSLVLENTPRLVDEIRRFVRDNKVGAVVVGESKDYSLVDNPIMKKVHAFKQALELHLALPIYFEPEYMTSAQAERTQGKNGQLDASAATIILQSFIDRTKS